MNESLWYDEIWSTRVILGSVGSTVRMLSADLHPPVFNLLMFVWIRIFGDSEVSVRVIPLICGLATVVLTARLAIDYGGRFAAPVTALVLAISPVHIWYSQESRAYSFLLLLTVALVVVFHRIRETHATRWYVLYALLAAGLVFTQYFAAIYVATTMVLALTEPGIRKPIWSIGLFVALAVTLFLAVKWLWGFVPTEASYLRRFAVVDLWRLPFDWMLAGGAFGRPGQRTMTIRVAMFAVQLPMLMLVVRGLFASRPRGELALFVVGLPLGLLLIGAAGVDHFYIERSGLTILPFLAVAIGVGVASLPRPAWRWAAVSLMAVVGAVVLVNYFAKADQWTVFKPNPDWRATTARLVAEHDRVGRPLVVVSVAPALELRYYDAGFGPAGLVMPGGEAPHPPVSRVREWLKRMFVVPAEPWRGQTGRVYALSAPDPALVRSVLEREQTADVLFIHQSYSAGSAEMLSRLRADGELQLEPIFEARSIRVIRIRRRAPGV